MKALACALLAISGSLAPGQVPSRVGERLSKGESLRIVVYGTSLTAGGAWTEQMRHALAKRYWGKVNVVNAAESGQHSDWGLALFDERVVRRRPDVLFIEFAVNDAVERFNLPLERSRANLEAMVDRVRTANPNVEVILQITNPVIGRPAGDPGHRPRLDDYFAMVRAVAAERKTVLIDQEEGWRRLLERGIEAYRSRVPDGLHPNPDGYAETATPTILRSLRLEKPDATRAYDLLVYGGTSAAVIAAVQARQMGKSVLLVSPDKHLGGLTINGLGWTDSGNVATIGGLSREFYHQVWLHYGDPKAWTWQPRESFGGAAQGTKARDDARQTMWTFEPHVAEGIFRRLIDDNEVPVVHASLETVYRRGRQIVGIRTATGQNVAARAFLDASYEGDLMALAGVRYTVGREANAQYGETLNGIQTGHAVKNQLPKGIRPKGLIGVNVSAGGPDGTGDEKIQAYCYRMVLTDLPENRRPVPKPLGYRERDYEILFRAIAQGQTDGFFKLDPVPNRKTDSNNSGGVSTDFIGMNYDYPNGDAKTRERIAKDHRRWQLGLLWTLQHSPRVPESVRKRYAPWGLPKDEFVDNDGWPYGLYVREARRMVGSTVLSERSLRDKSADVRSIGMGSYAMDSHNVQRIVGPEGFAMNEGDVQVSTNGPYAIDYGAIVPQEVDNLVVPVCLSATHIAYGSIRMEPVFMILGQSAATAAALALEGFVPVGEVSYPKLAERLRADGQVLRLP